MKMYKRIAAAAFCAILLCSTVLTAFAEEKSTAAEEVIYIMTDAGGTVTSVNAVHIFGSGNNTVYGALSDVKSLNTTDEIKADKSSYHFQTEADRVYVQGTMENVQIPWNISIRYELDGKEYSARDIAGKSGSLKIFFSITKNEKCPQDFYGSYALQSSLTLNTEKCRNIQADGATLANVGSNKQLSYTVLPGSSLNAEITADVTDFEMSAVSINGIRLSLSIEISDSALMEKINELTDAISKLDSGAGQLQSGAKQIDDGADQLHDGAGELASGAADLNSGVKKLNSGITKMNSGLNTLNGKSADLTAGSAAVLTALTTIQTKLSAVSASATDLTRLVQGSSDMQKGLDDLYSGITALQNGVSYDAYKTALGEKGLDMDLLQQSNTTAISSLNEEIATLQQNIRLMKALRQDTGELESLVTQLSDLITLLKGNNAAIGGTESYLTAVNQNIAAMATGAQKLKTGYAELDDGIKQLVDAVGTMPTMLSELKKGIDTLVENYTTLYTGVSDYTDGVSQIVTGYQDILTGTKSLLTGSASLKAGANELYTESGKLADGTGTLYDGAKKLADGASTLEKETGGLDTTVSEKIDEILAGLTGKSSKTTSFVDEKNQSVASVQFVIKTAAIEKAAEAAETAETPVKLTFWQKLLQLFGLYA